MRTTAPERRGLASSHRSARSTTAAVPSASHIGLARAPGRAARSPREEDHALCVARHVGEALDVLGLAAAARRFSRDRRPHPRVELAAKRLDQLLLLLRHLDVTLGEHYLTMTRLHSQEPHRLRIMANTCARDRRMRRPAAPARRASPRAHAREPEHVDG